MSDSLDVAAFVDNELSRRAIANLVINNNRATDERDAPLFHSLWHADAEYSIGGGYGDCHGVGEIDAGVARIWDALVEIQHWTSNLVVEFDDPDHAHAVSNVLSHCTDHDGRYFINVADYLDRFERRADGVWRFSRRDIVLHYRKQLHVGEYP